MRHLPLFILATSLLAFSAACGEDGPPPPPPEIQFGIDAEVLDLDGEPIAKVPVLIDESVVGYTDRNGVFKASLTERPGTEITLSVGERDGYRWTSRTSEVTEVLRRNTSGIGIPISLSVQGESRTREFLVWAKIECDDTLEDAVCEGRDILMNGEPVAKTDEFGHAHFTFREVPHQNVKFTIDTPESNPLSDEIVVHPGDPEFEVELGLDSHVFILEQTFTNARAEAKKPKKRTRKRRTRTKRPAKKKPPEKKSDPEVIDLW